MREGFFNFRKKEEYFLKSNKEETEKKLTDNDEEVKKRMELAPIITYGFEEG